MAIFLVEIDKMLTATLDGKEHYWKRTGDEVIVQWCETEEIMMAIKILGKKSLMAIFAALSHNIPKEMFPLFIHIVNTFLPYLGATPFFRAFISTDSGVFKDNDFSFWL